MPLEEDPADKTGLRGGTRARGERRRPADGEEVREQLHQWLHPREHLARMHKQHQRENGIGVRCTRWMAKSSRTAIKNGENGGAAPTTKNKRKITTSRAL